MDCHDLSKHYLSDFMPQLKYFAGVRCSKISPLRFKLAIGQMFPVIYKMLVSLRRFVHFSIVIPFMSLQAWFDFKISPNFRGIVTNV